MANVAHSALTGSDLHENKGAATASANTVATAPAGATVWAKLTASNLQTTGNPFGGQLFHLRQTALTGIAGGTLTVSTWTKRTVSSAVNEITSASVSSGVITLPAGTYRVSAWAVGNRCSNHQIRFRNTSDGTTAVSGAAMVAVSANGVANITQFSDYTLTISGTKNFELQHWAASTRSSDGQGEASSSGETEVYAEVSVWKIL